MDGGPGWVIQYPGGYHNHAYPGGKMRNHFQFEQPIGQSITMFLLGCAATLVLIADDGTVYGVVDDPLLVASTACFVGGLEGVLGKKVCSVCGEVRYGY